MGKSSCTISFFRNELQKTRLQHEKCPVKYCSSKKHKVPFRHYKGRMINRPFCPEHGLRIHKSGFVYYNGPCEKDLIIATKRNLMFHANYYVEHFFKTPSKAESHRLCYESSEDAVTYNVFTELLSKGQALQNLVKHVSNEEFNEDIELYLWGRKIDLQNNKSLPYVPLQKLHEKLEPDIKTFVTEPDVMLIVPKKLLICIEAKFGSKNPIAKEKEDKAGEKPKRKAKLIEKYCDNNRIIKANEIFEFDKMPMVFYEQLFRNLVFAPSMVKLAGIEKWYVVNLRSQHVMNLKRGKPESMPVTRNIRSILKSDYKKRFLHLTWEEIYDTCVQRNAGLHNLAWYMKNKTLNCHRAFNIF